LSSMKSIEEIVTYSVNANANNNSNDVDANNNDGNANSSNGNPNNSNAAVSLSPNLRSFHILWQENKFGIAGRKAARLFTSEEGDG